MAANKKVSSAVLYGKKDLRLEDGEFSAEPGKGEVLIGVQSVGICGSDIHFWVDGHIGDCTVVAPTILGHEASGVVIAIGEGVTNLQPGDRVAIEPGIPCHHCQYCKSGHYNHCPYVKFGSTSPNNGYLTNYTIHPAEYCFKLPDHVSFDEGALLEPVSVAVHACRRVSVGLGSKVLITGAGPIGLVCLMVAKACGASVLIATDLDSKRLEVAKSCGATHTCLIDKTSTSRQVAEEVKRTIGASPDITIECSGAASAISAGIYATKSGGSVLMVGLGAPLATLPIVDASVREVDLIGVFRYVNCFPAALDLIASGKINTKALLSHKYALGEVLSAFEMAKSGKAVKVIVDCSF
ncbi:PREDICTED: sorbitol dehydrogenase-like [Amphimedon queenslandica]|uniref:Sorbitol dehydrogenase n=1 Tax=Amphimedon queenslandica TaxID=400682 RepID=A0A1X7VNH9_AMPQE|nr:PREDICTED: sorbitol dehydrogenase-like [Amphimedon queenslandica]|eukprot:XP_003383541.1 PREDICTED: sorbitol dehydrogenase-like [Amphimedon queenslandica]